MIFQGSMVAIVTPFKNGKVDREALQKLVEFHVANGTHALVPCGTTGESATLTHAEHEEVIRMTAEFSAGRVKVLAGAGSNSTCEAVKLHKACEKISGVAGTLQITPYYNKPTQSGLVAHFKAVAESSSLPLVLYNVPGRTGVNMLPETVLKLSEIKNIVGVKEASGSIDQASEILRGAPKDFGVYSGEDSLTFPLYAMGASGVISVTANLVPKEMSEQFVAFQKGDMQMAREIHFRLYDLHRVLFVETNPIPVKAALHLMGFVEEEYRLPLVPMLPANREKLKAVLQKLGKMF